jgi:methionyl-tRNA formyltransferase
MRIALLFMRDNFVGREYFAALHRHGIVPALVASVGVFTEDQIARERVRTGGLWTPAPIPPEAMRAHFPGMKSPELWQLLRDEGIDVVLQGGIGIIKPEHLSVPRVGFLNIHPGRLPAYRGNACPEWQVFDGQPVFVTAHLIDAGIDTGPVILEREYPAGDAASYEAFRAGLYRHCAEAMVEALRALEASPDPRAAARPQNESGACYRPAMPEDIAARVRAAFPGWRPGRSLAG